VRTIGALRRKATGFEARPIFPRKNGQAYPRKREGTHLKPRAAFDGSEQRAFRASGFPGNGQVLDPAMGLRPGQECDTKSKTLASNSLPTD